MYCNPFTEVLIHVTSVICLHYGIHVHVLRPRAWYTVLQFEELYSKGYCNIYHNTGQYCKIFVYIILIFTSFMSDIAQPVSKAIRLFPCCCSLCCGRVRDIRTVMKHTTYETKFVVDGTMHVSNVLFNSVFFGLLKTFCNLI